MPVTDFHHYNLRADRSMLDRLRAFYVTVVGLKPGYRPPFGSTGYWLYIGSRDVLHLTEAPANEHRPAHAANTFDHVAFSGTDPRGFEAVLRENRIQYTSEQVPLTGQLQFFFSDPAGNGVELTFAAE
jgi:catechol 2,3-dioxygenase-like lactoylglutathione lyase family enzyme